MDEVLQFLKDNPTYYLATVDAEGNPQVRPFGTILKFEGRLYIQTGKVKNVSKQMAAHPRIAICTMSKEGTWLRIEADAVSDPRIEPAIAMLEDYPELKALYTPGDGNTEVLYLENAKAQFCSFTSDPRTVEF